MDIKAAVNQHFQDIGHAWDDQTVTFENGQARMRTLVLMDLANKLGGLVIGTGDLSELALGWATYNGDHMSMYGVNGSIPKTLVRYLTAYEAAHSADALKGILLDVLHTPRVGTQQSVRAVCLRLPHGNGTSGETGTADFAVWRRPTPRRIFSFRGISKASS